MRSPSSVVNVFPRFDLWVRRPRLLALAAVLSLAAFILWDGSSAQGHAILERSIPAANQSLSASPAKIEFWFTEPLDHGQTKVRVLDAAGAEVAVGPVQSSGDPIYAAVELPRTLGPGVYTVVYDNLSRADGHRWQGFFPFIVLNADGSQPAPAAFPAELVQQGRSGLLPNALDVVLRWASIVAAVVLLGGAVAHVAVVRPASRFLPEESVPVIAELSDRLLARGARAAAVVLLLGATGQAVLLVDRLGGFSNIGDVLLETRPGVLWLLRIGLAGVIAVPSWLVWQRAGRSRGRLLPILVVAASLGVIAAYSLASHASGGGGKVWAEVSDFLHFTLTGLWLGVLAHTALLWRPMRRDLDESERLLLTANLLDRFSAVAVISVLGLLATGVFSALVQIPELEALWQTTYGQVLLIKMALVAPLLAIAGVNAFFLKPALVGAIDEWYSDDDEAEDDEPVDDEEVLDPAGLESRIDALRGRLGKTIGMELGLGILVLASVALLSQTGTARGEIAQEAAEERAALTQASRQHETFVFNANKLAGDLAVALRIDPQLVGINTFRVELTSAEGRAIGSVEQVSLRFFYYDPAFGSTDSIPASFSGEAPGGTGLLYTLEGAFFSLGGGYRVQVDIQRTGVDDARAIFPLQVEERPEKQPSQFELPFLIGNGATTGAVFLLVLTLGLFLSRNQLGFLAPWAKPAAELLGIGALAISAVLALNAVVNPDNQMLTNPVTLTDASVERGRILFARNCAQCHGDTGRGNGPAGVNLRPQPADFLVHVPYHGDTTIFGWISNGVQGTGMPAWGDQLSEEQRWDLVNFLRKNFGDELANQKILEQDTPTPAPP